MKYYTHDDDDTLVMLTLAGDPSAYEVLVGKYRKAVIASALAVTKNYYMAEDAAQDAFVTGWIRLNTLREPSRFCGWVCKIARYSAINTLRRYASFLPYDSIENTLYAEDSAADPQYILERSEEKGEVAGSVEKLPERVGAVIKLHYYEGLSVADISERLSISEGAVKSQLHDGRRRIRKELCAMNEKWNDTLVQRVMKKVEELKCWQVFNSKDGFEKVYKSTLKEVDELPESREKNHALADVLMRGWWWLPGRKNDELFERIKNAAEEGKNDDVMEFILSREDSRVSGDARIDFIKNKQIPTLQENGFVRALGFEWFWLSDAYYKKEMWAEGDSAAETALKYLKKDDLYYGMTVKLKEFKRKMQECKDVEKKYYRYTNMSNECRYMDGKLRMFGRTSHSVGYFNSFEGGSWLFDNSACCDGRFFDESLEVGQSITGSDGSTLTFVSDSETVETHCGVFDGCQRWQTRFFNEYNGNTVCDVYYKSCIGIVRFEYMQYGVKQTKVLSGYSVIGGEGLLPIAEGNCWEYADLIPREFIELDVKLEVVYADTKKAIFISSSYNYRKGYDASSWEDTMRQIRHEYHCDNEKICDVSPLLERAEALAATSMQKLHTRTASSVARRIMATAPEVTENPSATGHWNFFYKGHFHNKNGVLTHDHCSYWSFEWKGGVWNNASYALLYNDMLGILQDAANCIWSEEWQIGSSPVVEYCLWGRKNIRTSITCTDGGSIETKAGRFDGCMRILLDIEGMDEGWSYRGGKKEYYFCPEIGIVKTVNYYCGDSRKAIYELTEYSGRGEGYMPVADGLYRKYEAIGLTDGYVGGVEYTFAADESGDVFVFADRVGIRNLPAPISSYAFIAGEVEEDELWENKKRSESRLRHDINNFNIMLHYLGRPSRTYAAPNKALEWGRHCIRFIENIGEGKGVPEAWLGRYGETLFRTACYCFGNGSEYKKEGYELLDKALDIYLKWAEYPAGAELDVGNEYIYGRIKYVKDKSQIKLPDGRVEPIEYGGILEYNARFIYRCLTAKYGWEWFNPVRNEDRFKEFIEKVKAFADKE